MAPTFIQIIPSLPVTSITDAVKYYTEVMGFRLCGVGVDTPHAALALPSYESQHRSESPTNLYLFKRGAFGRGVPHVGGSTIHIRLGDDVGGLKSLFNSLRAKNAAAISPITYDPLGANEFHVEDLDGNVIIFTQALPGVVINAPQKDVGAKGAWP